MKPKTKFTGNEILFAHCNSFHCQRNEMKFFFFLDLLIYYLYFYKIFAYSDVSFRMILFRNEIRCAMNFISGYCTQIIIRDLPETELRIHISTEMKYCQFGVWLISYNCLHEIPLNETHCGCYFISVILREMKFHFRL